MEDTCKAIVGQTPTGKTVHCGDPGITIGDVTKCTKHWAASRSRANKSLKKGSIVNDNHDA